MFFLVNDTTLAPDNPLHFRCNLLKKNIKNQIMTIEEKIRNKTLQYGIYREAEKITLSSG